MNLEEAHILERNLEKELREKNPNHPALKYYGSTWKAINAYCLVLYGYKLFDDIDV